MREDAMPQCNDSSSFEISSRCRCRTSSSVKFETDSRFRELGRIARKCPRTACKPSTHNTSSNDVRSEIGERDQQGSNERRRRISDPTQIKGMFFAASHNIKKSVKKRTERKPAAHSPTHIPALPPSRLQYA